MTRVRDTLAMRTLVTGIDANGQSCVLEETVLGPPGSTTGAFYETPGAPPPPRPAGRGDFVDIGPPAGIARWLVVPMEPGYEYGMHQTDTIDFDTVLAGNIDLILDDGPHPLDAGDSVVVAGVDHAWKAGPGGCTLSVLFLGTPPPDQPV
jgi:quercetin dioxygenase-like cupin family protein